MSSPGADLAACRAIMRTGSKSFTAAARLLPARVRDPATAFYAFCRVADDLVDERSDPRAGVTELQGRLDGIFAAQPGDDPVDRAFARVVADHRLPRGPVDALIDGFAWDAEARPIESGSDVLAYSARVASAVGVVMTFLMGPRDGETLARACEMGAAMQLTNIARDVAEDASRGRLYLPTVWMREEGLEPGAFLSSPQSSAGLRRVVERLLDAADELYGRADAGIERLPRDCRASIRAARLIYSEIGARLRARGCDPMLGRVSTSTLRKGVLLVRAYLHARKSERTPSPGGPLPEFAFLLAEPASHGPP